MQISSMKKLSFFYLSNSEPRKVICFDIKDLFLLYYKNIKYEWLFASLLKNAIPDLALIKVIENQNENKCNKIHSGYSSQCTFKTVSNY